MGLEGDLATCYAGHLDIELPPMLCHNVVIECEIACSYFPPGQGNVCMSVFCAVSYLST